MAPSGSRVQNGLPCWQSQEDQPGNAARRCVAWNRDLHCPLSVTVAECVILLRLIGRPSVVPPGCPTSPYRASGQIPALRFSLQQ
jgi:hypothetical protein